MASDFVTLKAGKQVTDRPEDGLTRREADALINLSEGDREAEYHFECETNGRSSIALRIVQYAAGYAAQSVSLIEDGAVLRLPHSAVIFLRSSSTDISELTIRVEFPGYSGSYKVPVLRIRDYTVEELFEKKLLMLIPFAFFKFSDEEYARMNETDVHQLREMIDDIGGRLNAMVESNEIEPWVRGNIVRYMRYILENLTKKYKTVMKGATEIMGGYIIKTDIDEAMDRGREEGLEKGREEGLEKGRKEERLSSIHALMDTMKINAQKAMDYLKISTEEQKQYAPLLKESAETDS